MSISKFTIRLQKCFLVIAAGFMLLLFPAATGVTFADTTPPPCTAPPQTGTGVHWPTGSDAGTFTYQCTGPYQGEWTNEYYVYNPATNQRSPLYNPNYTYDCTTGQWYMTQYDFSAASGTYSPTTVATSAPAGLATNCPPPATTSGTDQTSNQSGGTTPQTQTTTTTTNTSGTGTTATNLTGTDNTTITNNTGTNLNNGVTSIATSGDASVTGNTSAGDATSGVVQAETNIVNMLQSSSNVLGTPNMLTFTANINGDVNGDLLLDPNQLATITPANSNTNLNNNVTVNNSTDASINNNITLGATSGDATVSGNTTAGDATSGNASAVANIVNVLNSAVTAGQSFVGIININGDLNGDILLPPNFIDTLLASNVPRYTVTTATINNTISVTNDNNQSINNQVNESALSGNASVSDNTTGGSATTGSALTNLTVFNLTGANVVASNDLLVFVNVLGTWYGMILNAPAGTTAAELGGGVNSSTINNTATLNNTNNQSINNNIDVNSKTGNAMVADNTTGGDATSGNASSSVNLMNMINDSLSLNGWFGLLFINVFGTWNGSFGIDTAAGNPPVLATPSTGGETTVPTFRFVPKNGDFNQNGGTYTSNGTLVGTSGGSDSSLVSKAAVLAAKTIKPSSTAVPQLAGGTHPNYLLPALGIGLAGIILLAGERGRFLRRSH